MLIGGFHKYSTVDYPGLLSSVIFTCGCNMNCCYCHNRKLICSQLDSIYEANGIIKLLHKRKGLIDGVVISGGEPTLHEGLIDFIKDIKALGFKVKLDTNGTRPLVLKKLIESEMVDFIAMDIKAPPEKYRLVSRAKVPMNSIAASIELLMKSGIDYEFRTTTWTTLLEDDYIQILNWIRQAKKYVIQCCRTKDNLPMPNCSFNDAESISAFSKKAKEYVEIFETRGFQLL